MIQLMLALALSNLLARADSPPAALSVILQVILMVLIGDYMMMMTTIIMILSNLLWLCPMSFRLRLWC